MSKFLVLSNYYYITKILVIVFVVTLVSSSLMKNDKSDWRNRAINFYNFRTFDCYDFISDIDESIDIQTDIWDSTRYTEMEKRVHRLQSNSLSRRILLYGESYNYGDYSNDLGIGITI